MLIQLADDRMGEVLILTGAILLIAGFSKGICSKSSGLLAEAARPSMAKNDLRVVHAYVRWAALSLTRMIAGNNPRRWRNVSRPFGYSAEAAAKAALAMTKLSLAAISRSTR